MLTSFLDYYRATLLLKADGLSDEQARSAAVEPSDLSIMGLIRHMAEVERNWFQRWLIAADAPPLYYGDHDEDGDLHPGPDDTLVDAIAVFEREVERSRSITERRALARRPQRPHLDPPGTGRVPSQHALDPRAHDRGVRPPRRPRRPPPATPRRHDRRLDDRLHGRNQSADCYLSASSMHVSDSSPWPRSLTEINVADTKGSEPTI